MKKMWLQFKASGGSPPLTPFEMEGENSIIAALKRNGLLNRKEDAVKVIYYPAYLSRVDGMLSMNYYDAIIGCHLGVFPSYYESWGYTPLETAALGLPAVTTDLSGFGRYIKRHVMEGDMSISILHRDGAEYGNVVKELEDVMLKFYMMTKKQRIQWKIKAKQMSMLADWKFLIRNYIRAYDLALNKT
jgi:glycogen(starch) synthase